MPNAFSNLRDLLSANVQSRNNDRVQSIAETFEYQRSILKARPRMLKILFSNDVLIMDILSAKVLLCEVWKRLKIVKLWLHENSFNALFDFFSSNKFSSVESLFPTPVVPFLDQLGICPESDPFDSTLDYIGLLIYLYDGRDEFNLNEHQCKRGQILIRQKQNIPGFAQAPWYGKISFASLFIHEYLYEWYFNEKPSTRFYGIAFVYERNRWNFHVVTYAGLYGIHSIYDSREENSMASNTNEQRNLDLALSALYVNNKWQEELGCMYTIDELEAIARESFRQEVQTIEEIIQQERTNRTTSNEVWHEPLKDFIKEYTPKPSTKVS